MTVTDDKARISELEAEVARLRAQGVEAPEAAVDAGVEATFGSYSKQKVVMVAALVLLIALGLAFGIFGALSKGFDSLAHKAAETLTPDETAPAATPEVQDIPRVPGL